MSELVKVNEAKELVVSLGDISRGTGIKYDTIRKAIETNYRELMSKIPKGSFKEKFSLTLTEEQSYKILLILPNSEKVLGFKFALVEEFLRMREILRSGSMVDEGLKKHIEQFIPKGGYLEENNKGEIKTKPVRGYYKVDKFSEHSLLLNKKYQLQKRVNSLLRQEYELEIKMVDIELMEIENSINVA